MLSRMVHPAGEADQHDFWSELHAALGTLLASSTWEQRCGGLLLLKVPSSLPVSLSELTLARLIRSVVSRPTCATVQVALPFWPTEDESAVDEQLTACVALLEVRPAVNYHAHRTVVMRRRSRRITG